MMISNSGTSTLGLYDLKRQIDAFGGVYYFRPNLASGYLKNARVMLADGDIVKSTVDGNTNDPNVNMTGWVKTGNVSNKGKIGYSYGAGNTVTQIGNRDTTVTCDYPSGRIITSARVLGAGEMTTFILNNSYVGENDVLVANVRYSPSNSSRYYDIKVTNIRDGSCQINIKNSNSVALGEAIEISFCIIAGTRYHN